MKKASFQACLCSIWIALPLGKGETPKSPYVQPKLSVVQFGEQGIFKTLQGTEALQAVSMTLLILLCNVFAYGILCLGMSKQPDPIPAALVCLASAGRLWFLQLQLLRTNLIYRHEAFQRLLPLVLIVTGLLAALLCVDEWPLHKHLEFNLLWKHLRAVKLSWAAEVEPLGFQGIGDRTSELVVACGCCFWLLLWATASAPALEEVEGLKESLRKPAAHFHPRLWKSLEAAAPTLATDGVSSAFWTLSLLLMVPPIFKFASAFLDSDFLWWGRAALAAAALLLRIAAAKDLVQASLLRQSTDLTSILHPDAGRINTEEQKKALLNATRCVALANRTTATRMAEVLLVPTFLFLLLGAYTLVGCSSGFVPPTPPELLSRLGTAHAAPSLQAAAVSRAAAACGSHYQACQGCCAKTSALQEVLCPLVDSHFEAIREERVLAEDAQAAGPGLFGSAKARSGSLVMLGARGTAQPTAFELDCLSGAAVAAAQLGPTGSAWRPLFSVLFGSPQQRKEASQLFNSLSQSDAVKWFRYSLTCPPFLSTELLLFLQSLFFTQLLAASLTVALLEALASLRMRRQGPSTFSIWGPEVPARKLRPDASKEEVELLEDAWLLETGHPLAGVT
ncbi:hypothetical protein Esti_003238 [Eimeria stiedai]